MSFYDELEAFMSSIRMAQTGTPDAPMFERVTGRSGTARLLGPYGIRSDEWEELSAVTGIKGAPWQDKYAQEAVVRHQLTRLYNQYGKWDVVAVAWRAGEDVANRVNEGETLSQVIKGDGVTQLQNWVNDTMAGAQVVPSSSMAEVERTGVPSGNIGDTDAADHQDPFARAAVTSGPFANASLVDESQNKPRKRITPDRAIADMLTSMRDKQVARGEVDSGTETGQQRVGGQESPEAS